MYIVCHVADKNTNIFSVRTRFIRNGGYIWGASIARKQWMRCRNNNNNWQNNKSDGRTLEQRWPSPHALSMRPRPTHLILNKIIGEWVHHGWWVFRVCRQQVDAGRTIGHEILARSFILNTFIRRQLSAIVRFGQELEIIRYETIPNWFRVHVPIRGHARFANVAPDIGDIRGGGCYDLRTCSRYASRNRCIIIRGIGRRPLIRRPQHWGQGLFNIWRTPISLHLHAIVPNSIESNQLKNIIHKYICSRCLSVAFFSRWAPLWSLHSFDNKWSFAMGMHNVCSSTGRHFQAESSYAGMRTVSKVEWMKLVINPFVLILTS